MECKYESSVREIPHAQETVYQSLSDLRNLERIKERMPEEKVQGMEFDQDTMAVSMPPVGRIALRIIEREEPKTIKLEGEGTPVPLTLWIQLLPLDAMSCKMRLTLRAELNFFIRQMVSKPLQDGVENIANMLAGLPYADMA